MHLAHAVATSVPVITNQPSDVTVKMPSRGTFKVVATGIPSPKYQWFKKVKGKEYTKIIGASNAVYITPATKKIDNGIQYRCEVSNNRGSVISSAAMLKIQPADGSPDPVYTITASAYGNGAITPAGVVNVDGGASQTYTITPNTGYGISQVIVDGTPVLPPPSSYTFNDVTGPHTITAIFALFYPLNITINGSGTVFCNGGTCPSTVAAGSTMTFTQQANPGSVFFAWGYDCSSPGGTPTGPCIDANIQSPVNIAATFNIVSAPTITTQPVNITVTVGETATFTVVATGTPTPTYQWQKGIFFGRGIQFNNIAGATNSSYVISPVALSDNGVYQCVITNSAGSVTSNIVNLDVNALPPTIISPSNNGAFTTGSLNITAMVSAGDASISYISFYAATNTGSTLLGTTSSNTASYTYSWTNIPAGTYQLTAVTTYVSGDQGTSPAVTVTINSPAQMDNIDGNIASKTDALNNTTSYQYDNDNRLLKTTFADNSTVSYVYDPFGNQTSVTDQRNNTLTKIYDAYERLSQTKDPLNGITQYDYDTEGHLLKLTDANNNATNYTYDPNGHVLTQTNALNFVTTFTYDPVGNIATREDANNKTTSYTYDADNRLTNTAYPDNTSVVNVYDADGNKTFMTDITGQTSYIYDNDNRLLTKTDPASNVITYTYDGEGNRLTTVDQNNRTITNVYDVLNRLSTVQDQNGTTTYGYDADSNKLSVAMPNGVTESYTYDPLNRILTAVNTGGSGVISSYANTYDVAGMITKKTYQDGSWTAYSYDALNRLLEETKQTSSSIIYDYVYTYDPVGNRLTWTKNTTLGGFWNMDYLNMPSQVLTNLTNGGYGNTANGAQAVNLTRTYTYDVANRLSNWNYAVNIYSASFPVQTDTYTYDNNGNRLTKQVVLTGQESSPQNTTYGYDFENRLQSLSLPNGGSPDTASFIYSGEGLRVESLFDSAVTAYLYDGSNVLIETNGTNTTKTYTRGLDEGGGIGSLIAQNFTSNNTPTVQYYDYNDLGSASDLTTAAGAAANSYSYDAFGNLLSPQAGSDTNRYLFSSKEFDSHSGLDYFGGRYYDPEVGRWLTQDPLGFVNGPNVYAYVNNNPINLVDPYGFLGERVNQTNATQLAGSASLVIIVPGVGAGLYVSGGINLNGWDSSVYIQAQASGGLGGGFYASGAAGAGGGVGPSPQTGLGSSQYSEGDVGIGEYSASVSSSIDNSGTGINVSGVTPHAKLGVGVSVGAGVYSGRAYTATVSVSLSQIGSTADTVGSYLVDD